MPILQWLDRPTSLRRAALVPYHLLEEERSLSFGDKDTSNMLIEGDNLAALKALQPFFAGRVKCIFIDPPYNTKSAFEHYQDSLEHSQWLDMIYPRLELLRDLLSEKGSIWVTIDDNEAHYLKVIMDEIFGRKNFIANCVWQKKHTRANDARWISDNHDHIICHAKNKEKWHNIPRCKRFLSEVQDGLVPISLRLRDEVGDNQEAKTEVKTIDKEDVFSTPKPERLIKRVLEIATQEDDLVLDSFLGSGTTAAVAHKMGRHYIGIELGEHAKTHAAARLRQVVEGEQGGISKAVDWQGGGGFRFYKLGEALFDENGMINPNVTFGVLAAFIWFKNTLTPYQEQADCPLLGIHDGIAYYLLYNGILKDKSAQGGNILTRQVLAYLPPHPGKRVIYANGTRLGHRAMEAANITLRPLPWSLKGA